MLGEMSGTRNGRDWPERGSVVDLPDDEAQALIRGRMARPATPTDEAETATAPQTDVESRPLTTQRGPTRSAEDKS
jgi:hypothetical protein